MEYPQELVPATQTLHWMSSVEGKTEVLDSRHITIMDFYATGDEQEGYREMLDGIYDDFGIW